MIDLFLCALACACFLPRGWLGHFQPPFILRARPKQVYWKLKPPKESQTHLVVVEQPTEIENKGLVNSTHTASVNSPVPPTQMYKTKLKTRNSTCSQTHWVCPMLTIRHIGRPGSSSSYIKQKPIPKQTVTIDLRNIYVSHCVVQPEMKRDDLQHGVNEKITDRRLADRAQRCSHLHTKRPASDTQTEGGAFKTRRGLT